MRQKKILHNIIIMSRFRMLVPKYVSKKNRRRASTRTRGPGRGYRPGLSRFGRISQPELKSVVLARSGDAAAASTTDLTIFPTIDQGINEDQRIGNRINGKFLNLKLMLSKDRDPEINLPATPCIIRWVMWQNKDPTSNANGTIAGLSLTSFLNTKTIRVLKTGYCTLANYGQAKVLKINTNLKNQVMDFKEDADMTVNTTQRVYFTMYSSNQLYWEYQSKFYFADP